MRRPMVSRTFRGYDVTVLILNIENRKQEERVIFIERMPTSDKKAEALIRSRVTETLGNNEKFVTELRRTAVLRRFFMTEQEFLSSARQTKLLPGAAEKEEEEHEDY